MNNVNKTLYIPLYGKAFVSKKDSNPDAVILHIGCGMDSRVERVGTMKHEWYDIDFPEVIAERMRYYKETSKYHMLAADARKIDWLQALPKANNAIVVKEGVSITTVYGIDDPKRGGKGSI